MSQLRRTQSLLAVVFVVVLALFSMPCPEQTCFDCADDDVAGRPFGLTALVPALALVPERIEAPALLGHSCQHKWIWHESATHPALVARLVI